MRGVKRKPQICEKRKTPETRQETLGWGLYDKSDEVRDKYGEFFADILTVGPGWQKGYDIGRVKGKRLGLM